MGGGVVGGGAGGRGRGGKGRNLVVGFGVERWSKIDLVNSS